MRELLRSLLNNLCATNYDVAESDKFETDGLPLAIQGVTLAVFATKLYKDSNLPNDGSVLERRSDRLDTNSARQNPH